MLNYQRLLLLVFCSILLACSPKVIRTTPGTPDKTSPEDSKKEERVESKFTEANIVLLIPFKLNELKLKTASKTQIERANMAIDFYQGFKMGINSAAYSGLNFKVNVYDTRDDDQQLVALQREGAFKDADLLVGPVFPEGVKHMADYSLAKDLTMVSPLAATRPQEFNNPKLISIVNHIDLHAGKIAAYIGNKYPAASSIVVLINPHKKDDEEFATPLKASLRQKFPNLTVQEFASANVFETRMIKGKKYAVVVCSSDIPFVNAAIDKLTKLSRLKTGGYDINLFGHPNWVKQTYNIDNLQALNTIVSSSYFINYKSPEVINFIKNYRANYQFEPSEYAFKGFDIGLYFGKLLSRYGQNYLNYLTRDKYTGLHNTFKFDFDPAYGYFNDALMLVQYKNLALNRIN